jgi:hypothetical protein
MNNDLIINTSLILSILLGTIIPIVTGIITKAKLNESIRGLVTLTISAITGFLTTWSFAPDSDHFNYQSVILASTLAWVTAIASHYGVLDKAVTGPDGAVQRTTGRYGLG